jgi:hypothetical protein
MEVLELLVKEIMEVKAAQTELILEVAVVVAVLAAMVVRQAALIWHRAVMAVTE